MIENIPLNNKMINEQVYNKKNLEKFGTRAEKASQSSDVRAPIQLNYSVYAINLRSPFVYLPNRLFLFMTDINYHLQEALFLCGPLFCVVLSPCRLLSREKFNSKAPLVIDSKYFRSEARLLCSEGGKKLPQSEADLD